MLRTRRDPWEVCVLRLSVMRMARRPRSFERAIKPSVAPIDQPKAVHFAVVAWGLDQTLPTPPLETPDACERRMKGELHLILQVEVGVWQSPEELWHIGRKLTPQISLD